MRADQSKTRAPFATAREVFGIDLRSLALFRVSLGLVVLADVATRACDLTAHYTDAGVLPRSDVLTIFPWLHAWPFCLHLASGARWGQALLFAAHALFALAMLVGYRTRPATFLVWLFTMSVQLRNLYIGAGWDAQLRMLLFWSMFLPLGARHSVDRIRRGGPERLPQPYCSVGTTALLAQIVILYLSTGYAKTLETPWWDGTAVASTLNDEFWVTGFGLVLLRFPLLCRLLTHAVLWLELVGPFLFFVPVYFGPIRTAAVAAFLAMHIGFHFSMRVGLFPWTSAAALTVLLPPWFWERFPGTVRCKVAAVVQRGTAFLSDRLPGQAVHALASPGWISETLCGVCLAYVVMWNVGVIRDPNYEAPAAVAWLGKSLFLQQDWRMFATVSTRTGRIVVPGRLRNGTEIDLFSLGGPVPATYQAGESVVSERLAHRARDQRWLNFTNKMAFEKRGQDQLLMYGRYLCRNWNSRHTGGEQLETLEIFFLSRPVTAAYPTPGGTGYQKQQLWTHWCFG
jgi:hypothetical protein